MPEKFMIFVEVKRRQEALRFGSKCNQEILLVHLKICGTFHHGVNLLQRKLSVTGTVKEDINLANTKFLGVTASDSGKEQGLEAIRGEADEGAIDEATGTLPSDRLKTLKAELNLVRHSLERR